MRRYAADPPPGAAPAAKRARGTVAAELAARPDTPTPVPDPFAIDPFDDDDLDDEALLPALAHLDQAILTQGGPTGVTVLNPTWGSPAPWSPAPTAAYPPPRQGYAWNAIPGPQTPAHGAAAAAAAAAAPNLDAAALLAELERLRAEKRDVENEVLQRRGEVKILREKMAEKESLLLNKDAEYARKLDEARAAADAHVQGLRADLDKLQSERAFFEHNMHQRLAPQRRRTHLSQATNATVTSPMVHGGGGGRGGGNHAVEMPGTPCPMPRGRPAPPPPTVQSIAEEHEDRMEVDTVPVVAAPPRPPPLPLPTEPNEAPAPVPVEPPAVPGPVAPPAPPSPPIPARILATLRRLAAAGLAPDLCDQLFVRVVQHDPLALESAAQYLDRVVPPARSATPPLTGNADGDDDPPTPTATDATDVPDPAPPAPATLVADTAYLLRWLATTRDVRTILTRFESQTHPTTDPRNVPHMLHLTLRRISAHINHQVQTRGVSPSSLTSFHDALDWLFQTIRALLYGGPARLLRLQVCALARYAHDVELEYLAKPRDFPPRIHLRVAHWCMDMVPAAAAMQRSLATRVALVPCLVRLLLKKRVVRAEDGETGEDEGPEAMRVRAAVLHVLLQITTRYRTDMLTFVTTANAVVPRTVAMMLLVAVEVVMPVVVGAPALPPDTVAARLDVLAMGLQWILAVVEVCGGGDIEQVLAACYRASPVTILYWRTLLQLVDGIRVHGERLVGVGKEGTMKPRSPTA
ncbi:hypothetical protein GGF32_006015 [Allomyces javanicus]|nr:hypothetical protein GGF32_006015 [Allomyces javanicus]